MNFKDMTTEQLLERRSAIATEIEAPDADLNALEAEARAINEELEARRAAAAQRENVRGMVAQGAGTVIASAPQEQRTVQTDEEVRASARYCNAWKNYIINGDPSECRSLLTANASGAVPVPTILEAGIQTAWENDPIMSRVRRTYIRGNLKVGSVNLINQKQHGNSHPHHLLQKIFILLRILHHISHIQQHISILQG